MSNKYTLVLFVALSGSVLSFAISCASVVALHKATALSVSRLSSEPDSNALHEYMVDKGLSSEHSSFVIRSIESEIGSLTAEIDYLESNRELAGSFAKFTGAFSLISIIALFFFIMIFRREHR